MTWTTKHLHYLDGPLAGKNTSSPGPDILTEKGIWGVNDDYTDGWLYRVSEHTVVNGENHYDLVVAQ